MSVISCREIWRGRDGRFNGLLDYELTRVFRVLTDSAYDDTTVILAAGVLPLVGAADTISPALTVRGYQFRQMEESPKLWLVSVQYSSKLTGGGDPENPDNDVPPLDRPVKITWSAQERQRVVERDVNGVPVLNSANDPFDDPLMADDQRLIATVTCNVLAVPSWILSYRGSMNSDAIVVDGLPVPEECALFKFGSLSEPLTEQGQTYRRFVYSLHLNEDTWWAVVVDRGWNELSPGAQGGKAPMTVDGQIPDAPLLLNGNGLRQDAEITTGVPLLFQIYRSLPYGGNLPGIS